MRGRGLRLVVGQGLTLVTIGLGIGLLAALGISSLMTSRRFGISPRDPLTFIAVPIVLGAMPLVASYTPARRSA